MGRLSDADANALLDSLYGSGTPATRYYGLSTTQPANDGTNITEPSGGSYARVAVTNNSTNWPAASARAKSNGTAMMFPSPTGSWGVIGWWVEMSASSGGTMKDSGALNNPGAVNSGDPAPGWGVGGFVITCPG